MIAFTLRAAATNSRIGPDRPKHVRHSREGDDLDAIVDQAIEVGQVDEVILGEREVDELGAGVPGDQLPRHHVGVVLHGRQQDAVAFDEAVEAPSVGHGVHGARGPSGEHELPMAGRIDEGGNLAAGALV